MPEIAQIPEPLDRARAEAFLSQVFAINVDLTVVLWRELPGDWIFISARMVSDRFGAGMAETDLSDAAGRAGKVLQTLVVSNR